IPGGNQVCNGQTIPSGSSCYAYVSFAPTAAGHRTGTVTFNNSSNSPLVSVPLDGFAVNDKSSLLDPTTLNFLTSGNQVVGTTSGNLIMTVYNTGDTPLTVGTITGSNLGAGHEFSLVLNGCTSAIAAGSSCNTYFNFTPSSASPPARSSTVTFPITYSDGTTTNLSGNLTGTSVAEINSAEASPSTVSFVDQTVGVTTTYNIAVTFVNNGNLSLTLGAVTGTNLGLPPGSEFSDNPAQGGSDGCSG